MLALFSFLCNLHDNWPTAPYILSHHMKNTFFERVDSERKLTTPWFISKS